VADFFRGKSIRIIVGGTAGGADDAAGRAVAMFIGRHIAGAPSVVVENMPGGNSLKMTNYVYNVAPRDGTVIGVPNSNLLLEPQLKMMERSGGSVQFDLNRLAWLGSAVEEPAILWFLHDSPIKSIEDLKTNKAIVGATAPSGDNYILPTLLNAMLRTNMKIVTGYAGPADIFVAAERGEVQGAAAALSNLIVRKREWWQNGTARVLVQFGAERTSLLNNVPTAIELAPNEAYAQMLRFWALKYKLSRVFFLPPETPAAVAGELRRAFNETMADPGFLDQAKKFGLEISPVDGEETASLIRDAGGTPGPVVDKLRSLISAAGE
jgi:tripartite-type tricarboxylate transporter receptor subunit TctC